jgi:serine/threonine protein kinase
VRWIGLQHYTAEEFTEKASLKLRKGLRSILVKGKKIKMVTLLINERRPAAGILNLELLSKADKKNILYQIIFTLAQLENLGYQHNDLRLGNILIDHVPDEKTIHYAGRVLPIRKKALLFDWDLGLCQSCGANPILDADFCPNYGMCNILNPRFDIYTLLRAYDIPGDAQLLLFKKFAGIPDRIVKVYDYNGQDGAYQKITPVIPPDSITQAWVDRMCNYDTLNKKCIPFPLGEPKTIRRPTELINHPYFRDLFLA